MVRETEGLIKGAIAIKHFLMIELDDVFRDNEESEKRENSEKDQN